MFNFFAAIARFVGIIVNYITTFFRMLLQLVFSIGQAMFFVADVLFYLPGYLSAYVLAMVGLALILFFINRSD